MDLDVLVGYFNDTLSNEPELRRRGEKALSDAADTTDYAVSVLRIVKKGDIAEHIRQCAAVSFKNHVKSRWLPSSATPIPDGEKGQIKSLLVDLMLSAAPRSIQAQLSEALAVIGIHDFPELWPDLLPSCKSSLEIAFGNDDYGSVVGVLAVVNSVCKKFRCQPKSDALILHLKRCQDNFGAPLLGTFENISAKMNGAAPGRLLQLIEAQRLCCRIYYSLNFLGGLPEENIDQWMSGFKKCLTVSYESGIEEEGGADGPREAVCAVIIDYMEKKEEVFLKKHLKEFVEAVGGLLVVASASRRRERLTVIGIKCLTSVSTSVEHHELFGGDEIRDEIAWRIVIPNVMLWDEDVELFEINYVEFIRRDMGMDGCDLYTRRRSACELLKGIIYKQERVSRQIKRCLELFGENPAENWRYKDCAIYLVVSLATKEAGGASISTDVVDFNEFFGSVVVPVLQQEQGVNSSPMLQAAALKFLTMFGFPI